MRNPKIDSSDGDDPVPQQQQQENLKPPAWYSFDRVSANYTGPVVEGWPPSRSRWMPLYVRPEEDSFLIRPEVDLDKTRIIVIVHSGDRMERRRKANRDSWIRSSGAGCSRNCYKGVRVIFHVGASENMTVMEQIKKESKIHKDILQVGQWTLSDYLNIMESRQSAQKSLCCHTFSAN